MAIDECQKMMQMIDVAVPLDCNVSAKEIEKIEEYKVLSIEILVENEMRGSYWKFGLHNKDV